MLRRFLRRVRAMFHRNAFDREMDDEMRHHLAMQAQENLASDVPAPAEAIELARRQFGHLDSVKEAARAWRGIVWLENVVRDLRYAARSLRKSPGFAVVAILTLSIGLGATTAIFGVMNTHLLDPIPGENEDRLIEINEIHIHDGQRSGTSAYLFQLLSQHADIFSQATALTGDYLQVSDGTFYAHVQGTRVTREFFEFFNEQPALGRWLTDEEWQSGTEDLIVISHAWWQSRFGGDPAVLGKTIEIRNRFHRDAVSTIIGVMPPHFQFPNGYGSFWRPLHFSAQELTQPWAPNYTVFSRLVPNVSKEAAQSALNAMREVMARDHQALPIFSPAERTTLVRPMRDFFVAPEVRATLWSVAVGAGVVLLIVCANLANLQLARGEARSREISVRAALGAGRGRILRQLLTESVALSLVGGAGGLLLALWLRQLATALLPEFAPVLRSTGLDRTTLGWTFSTAALCGIVFGLVPAWRAAGCRPGSELKAAAPGASASAGQRWFRDTLVVAQVALAMTLVVAAGLLARSMVNVLRVDRGLDATGLVEIFPGVPLNHYKTPEEKLAVTRALVTGLKALPGTISVGATTGGGGVRYYLQDNPKPLRIQRQDVGIGDMDYFATMGVELKDGRWFELSDGPLGMRAVLVNESLASACWPGQSAIGKRIYGTGPGRQHEEGPYSFYEVVGVVRDFRIWSLEADHRLMMFEPSVRRREMVHALYLRTSLDPASVAAGVRRISKDVIAGPGTPEINWIEEQLYASTTTRRMLTWLLASLAGVGLFLAMLGIFGVLLHNVVRRTKEIGIRIALGAQKRDVLTMVLRRGMALVAVGTALGLAAAFGLTRLMRGLLFGVAPHDPLTFVALPILLLVVAAVTSWLPARRAAKVNPVIALRAE